MVACDKLSDQYDSATMQSHMIQERIFSEQNLTNLAEEIISVLPQKETAHVIALHGDLGAGKTTFVKTLAKQLGVLETVTSPTFVVMKQYSVEDGPTMIDRLIHIDAYRIEDVEEMRVLHFNELLRKPDTIICIEWAERIRNLLPQDHIAITFTIGAELYERAITVDGY